MWSGEQHAQSWGSTWYGDYKDMAWILEKNTKMLSMTLPQEATKQTAVCFYELVNLIGYTLVQSPYKIQSL